MNQFEVVLDGFLAPEALEAGLEVIPGLGAPVEYWTKLLHSLGHAQFSDWHESYTRHTPRDTQRYVDYVARSIGSEARATGRVVSENHVSFNAPNKTDVALVCKDGITTLHVCVGLETLEPPQNTAEAATEGADVLLSKILAGLYVNGVTNATALLHEALGIVVREAKKKKKKKT